MLITFTRYPTLYAVCVLPLSVIRWIRFVQEHKYGTSTVSHAATFAGSTLFNFSGLFNVVLLLKTRPDSGLFGRTIPPGLPSAVSVPEKTSKEDEDHPQGRLPD